MDKIIVTFVTNADKSKWPDFELPTHIPCQMIAEKISRMIKEGESQRVTDVTYMLEVKVGEHEWKILPLAATLFELGVRSGAYLRVQRNFSTGNKDQTIEGWRSLYQQQIPEDEHVHTRNEKKDKNKSESKGYVWKTL
ncbi:hypothetical protein [Brevibacillus laterosporus]|uniref:hypothetical protein n=1 Tax=Brevibacillus laterosporus TaxID=1465 RepID=UPI000B9A3C77|nr:hypothetical protein [Brevibacillus laterosporus]